MSRAILITGATGKQGGATLRALAASDPSAKLLAVTRNAASASARALASRYPQQVSLVQGNLDDAEALFASAEKATSEPIWGVFSVQVRHLSFLSVFISCLSGRKDSPDD